MQKIIVFFLVCGAVLFLSRKLSNTFGKGNSKGGCGSGCGCSKADEKEDL